MGEVKRYRPIDLMDAGQAYGKVVLASDYATLEAENARLRAELERRAVPDDWREVVCMAIDLIQDIRQGTAVERRLRELLAAAPSAPKADDPVKVQLLEALEKMLTPAVRPLSGNTLSMSPVKMVAHIEAAIAAARQEGKV